MIVDNERPPLTTFHRDPVEDRNASIAAGRYIAKDVDFVTVTRPGARDNFVTVASEYAETLRDRARAGLIPPDWPEKYEAAYARWLKGETAPEVGTPIKGWGLLSPATQEMLIRWEIRTVEDLAALPDSEVMRLGMGMQAAKDKAKAFLEAANSAGAVAAELSTLKQQVRENSELVEKLIAENKRLSALVSEQKSPEKTF